MSSTADILRGGAAALSSGQTLDSNTIDTLSTSGSESHASEADDGIVRAENSTQDDYTQNGESGDTPPASSGKQAGQPRDQKTSGEKEVITVTDENGRRRQIEVDYSNRESIKKAHQMAAGARKWQAERDQSRQEAQKLRQENEQRARDWDTLEQAYQQGPEALFDLLEGRRGAFDAHVQKRMQRAEFLKNASPEEVEALQAREAAAQHQRELERVRQENEKFRKEITQERETAELRSLESRVNPVFDKYRFADKLGNPDDEHLFDEMLWNSALKRLEPYEEKGLEISPELVEREFRSVASAIRRRIGQQAEKSASRAVQQKKQEATENVQARVRSGYRNNNQNSEAMDLVNQGGGGLTQLFKNWGKYGSSFGGGNKR